MARVFEPLSARDVERVHRAALDLLATVGMGSPTARVTDVALAAGCTHDGAGRLMFPSAVVEDALAGAARYFTVHGRDPDADFEARNDRVNFCTGGAAVSMLDIDTRQYRPSNAAR